MNFQHNEPELEQKHLLGVQTSTPGADQDDETDQVPKKASQERKTIKTKWKFFGDKRNTYLS